MKGLSWTVADADKNALVVGRDDELHLHSDAAACVQEIDYHDASGKDGKATFKPDGETGILATLPLKDAQPGAVLLSVKQYGQADAKTLNVASFAEAGKYDGFTIHAGDRAGVLSGTRLDEVASLELQGAHLLPGKLTRNGNADALELQVPDPAAAGDGKALPDAPETPVTSLPAGTRSVANVALKDGRIVPVPVSVNAPRPSVTLINKNVQLAATAQPAPEIAMKLGAPDELPLDGKLTFALKSQAPANFGKGEAIEIATADGLASVTFSLASGQLVLQDAKTAIATLDPAKSFGASAFGPLHLRPILEDGTAGDWVPVATLVRLPALQGYSCPADATQSCTLSGSSLFLLDSVSADPSFAKPVPVPDGFGATTLDVPRATNGQLFVKLRDDPAVVNTVTVDAPNAHAAARRVHHAPAIAVPSASGEGTPGSAGSAAAGATAAAPSSTSIRVGGTR